MFRAELSCACCRLCGVGVVGGGVLWGRWWVGVGLGVGFFVVVGAGCLGWWGGLGGGFGGGCLFWVWGVVVGLGLFWLFGVLFVGVVLLGVMGGCVWVGGVGGGGGCCCVVVLGLCGGWLVVWVGAWG